MSKIKYGVCRAVRNGRQVHGIFAFTGSWLNPKTFNLVKELPENADGVAEYKKFTKELKNASAL
jgi:hypothetical protein